MQDTDDKESHLSNGYNHMITLLMLLILSPSLFTSTAQGQ